MGKLKHAPPGGACFSSMPHTIPGTWHPARTVGQVGNRPESLVNRRAGYNPAPHSVALGVSWPIGRLRAVLSRLAIMLMEFLEQDPLQRILQGLNFDAVDDGLREGVGQ